MKHVIAETSVNVRLEEGPLVIEQLLIVCYLQPGISTKELARKTFLPVPVTAAVKKELIKVGALEQRRGVYCTSLGKAYMENACGYGGLNKRVYEKLMASETARQCERDAMLSHLTDVFQSRPRVNVQIDQSKCTTGTSLDRALLCLREHSLIGKRILCVGDDDLVSVALGFLLKRLFPNTNHQKTVIDVIDIDERFINYIGEIAVREELPIKCHHLNLRQPIPETLHGQYDCFFTDPPYTLQGISLFMSRGISALKREKGLPVFLSIAHKSPDFTLSMQRSFVRMGLMVKEIIPHFNAYEGAQMIGSSGQMIVLKTTDLTSPEMTAAFEGGAPLYTGEVKRTERIYRCKQCHEVIRVGESGEFATIESLKSVGCPYCHNDTFNLIKKMIH